MDNRRSERRIRNNKLKRKRQLRRHIAMFFITVFMIIGFSVMLFSFKTRAQSSMEDMIYKYYKSIAVEAGDTIWDFAELYADAEFYDSYESYIMEVMEINHLENDSIICGQHIIIPYYSKEFRG